MRVPFGTGEEISVNQLLSPNSAHVLYNVDLQCFQDISCETSARTDTVNGD